ncbi:hypothetical protein RvY_09452-2 [Ramazzottius varieornatus]|uniref:K Homology domain-containing protein n=1 Tax=Ramazzottius varieornatus TaxID=947166 RepID=A0A1D1VII8_RAMVA|nr:hypothetical protein RvY_09452-2 [Ramazzottius varieornatus]
MAASAEPRTMSTGCASPADPRSFSAASNSSASGAYDYSSAKSYNGGGRHSTSSSPSLSPKSSPFHHTSNDTLNSSASVSSASGISSANSSGVSSFISSSPGSKDTGLAEYLSQLIKEKKTLSAVPGMLIHGERLLDEEISKVRINLFQLNGGKEPLILPEEQGAVAVDLTDKVYVPVKEYPDFNFVGRILGPRGLTAKELEKQTGCKIMIRGKGSMRDKNKEMANKGKPNWEHLNDELHVLINVHDTPARARAKLDRAVDEINKLLKPCSEAEDELKKRQLMELAILNGTYRDSSPKPQQMLTTGGNSQYYMNAQSFMPAVLTNNMQRQSLAGNSLILNHSPRQHQHQPMSLQNTQFSLSDATAAAAAAGLLFHQYDPSGYAQYNPALAVSILNEYGLLQEAHNAGGFHNLHR